MAPRRPAEAWIVDGDQQLALLAAFQMHISRNKNVWWPQYASILFPDRHLGSAQNRWFSAERAAQILAKVISFYQLCLLLALRHIKPHSASEAGYGSSMAEDVPLLPCPFFTVLQDS